MENESKFTGGVLGYIGWSILSFIVTVITLGIYGLWVPIKLEQWKVKNTHFDE
ncbi:MAG: hypothetical protein R3Y38_07590 [Rikenellaceae bacterium]